MNQTIFIILWLIGLVLISIPMLLLFRNRISNALFRRTFTALFIVLVALIVFGQILVAAGRAQNLLLHPNYLAILAVILITLSLLSMGTLMIWVYLSSRDWNFAFKVGNTLKWPVKDKHLMNELSKLQIGFWKMAAFLRLVSIVIVSAVIAVKIILLFRF